MSAESDTDVVEDDVVQESADASETGTTSADERSASTALRTSSRWPREASGPIRTDSSPGLPTVIVDSFAVIASPASSVAVTASGESAASAAFCSRSAGASMRAYAGSPCVATRSA